MTSLARARCVLTVLSIVTMGWGTASATPEREQYNACSNTHFIPLAKQLGIPLNSKPTKAQLRRLQSAIDEKCGHLLKGSSPSALEQKVVGLWEEADERGRVLGTYEFKDGQYEMQNLYLVVIGRGGPMVKRGSYTVIGEEILAKAKDSSGLMRTDIFVLKGPNCLMQIAEIVRGKRSDLPKDMQGCARKRAQ